MMTTSDEWISASDAAAMLCCWPEHIRAQAKSGKLEARRIRCRFNHTAKVVWHVRRADIEAMDEFALVHAHQLTTADVSDQLGCGVDFASTLMASGRMYGVKVFGRWRTTQEAVNDYKSSRLPRRPGMAEPPIRVQWRDHNAPCARCICAMCVRLEACPAYARIEPLGQRNSGLPRLANRCGDPRFCANDDGSARRDRIKEPLELRPPLTYVVGYGWMRHDDAMTREAEAICRHFVRDCGFHEQKESVWSAMMRRAGLVR